MINKDIEKLFGNSIDELVKATKQKWAEAMDKIDQEKKYREDCNKAKNEISDSLNHINEILDLDLTTKEGYSRYMEYLADLRNRVKSYDGFLKAVSGKTGAEIIDEIAQKATTFYEENKKEQEAPIKVTEDFKKGSPDNSKEIVEPACDECKDSKYDDQDEDIYEEDVCNNPSDIVDENVLESINRIVNRYIDESLLPNYNYRLREDDLDWLTDELVEFACWLNCQYPVKK